MSPSRFDTLFEAYLLNISLTKEQAINIDTKLSETLALFLSTYDGDIDIYSQGSFAMGTIVRPLTKNQSTMGIAGEYDIDIALERSQWIDAQTTLNGINEILRDEYGNLVDKKKRESCERVAHSIDGETGVNFHIDYVPIKLVGRRHAAKRSENIWFPSDTKRLVEWFKNYSDKYVFLPSIIIILKRIRDYANLNDDFPSICITALACMYYEDMGSYADDLTNIIDKIISHLAVPFDSLSIKIDPVDDDLAKKISIQGHLKIINLFKNCRQALKDGFKNEDASTIQKYLSPSFPSDFNEYPDFLESLRNRGLGLELDGSLNITDIYEDHGKGTFIRNNYRKFFESGNRLIFRANEYDKQQFGIRWQVLNSDESPDGKRRGNLFKARGADGKEGSNSNEFINNETEQYNGEHWIKCFIYNKQTKRVVEIGRKFFVKVEK